MIFKKAIWMLFALLIGFSAISLDVQNVYAAEGYFSAGADSEGSDCGVSGGDMVAAKSFSICKEDLAYNILYMAFSKIFNEFDILKAFVFENAGSLDMEGYANNMGGAIMAIILGVTQVIFIGGAIVLGLTTVKVIYNSMTSGEFLGKGVSKVWLILRSLLVIFLIFPIGTVSLSQLGVLIVAMFALMGGNFFYGLFLSTVQKEALISEDTESKDSQATALAQADSLVSASLCQTRTIKAIRQQKFKHYKENFFSFADSLDFSKQIERVSNCIAPQAYAAYPTTSLGANSIKTGSVENITIGKTTSCEGAFDSTFLSEYDPEYHGASFNCGTISFSNPKIADEVNSASGQDDATSWFSTSVSSIADYTISEYQSYGLASKLANYYSKAKSNMGSEFSFSTLDADADAFAATLTSKGLALYNNVKAETDHNTAVKSLYVANSILFNNLMGGKVAASESTVGASDILLGGVAVTGAKEVAKMLQDRYAIKSGDAYKDLEKYSVNASSLLDMAHCVRKFPQLAGPTYNTVLSIGSAPTNFEDFVQQSNSVYFGECLWFTSAVENEQGGNKRYNIDGFNNSTQSGMIVTMGDLGESIKTPNATEVPAKMANDQVKMMLEAQANKLALASHIYVVREGIKRSMLAVLAEATDKELPKKMRKQGFASFGGFILQISADQTNVSKYIKKIYSGVNISAYSDGASGSYINEDAYSNVDMSVEANRVNFENMILDDFFSAGGQTSRVASGGVNGGSTASDDMSFVDDMLNILEDSLTAPMVYLKKMGGTDLNLPLREGVEKCFKEGNCYPGDVHPVNALSYMGVDLVDTAITFYMIKIVVNFLAGLLESDDGNAGSVMGGIKGKIAGIVSKFPIGKIVTVAIMVANGIVNFLAPIFGLLLLAGVFFGYMIPIIPYVGFLIMFLGWIVYIFQLLITVPIWLVMIAIPDPSGQPRGNIGMLWQYTGLLLLKPSLMVIGMIFGWYFAVLSIFFINMTFFGVMGTVLGDGSYGLIGLLDLIMFYFVYLVIVFIALKHSFSIISSFPQTVAEALELRGYNDSRTIQQVGAEQLLGLMIVKQVKDSVAASVKEFGEEFKNVTGRGREKQLAQQQLHAARQAATERANVRVDDFEKEFAKKEKNFTTDDVHKEDTPKPDKSE